jgi:hypothetical protein
MHFQIVLVKPSGFDFVESFREVMEVLEECLVRLGHTVRVQTNQIEADAIPILFGAHHIDPSAINRLPKNSIVFNLEQLAAGYPWFNEQYLQTLSRFRVWDYSTRNIDYLRRSGVSSSAVHVPFGYAPCLVRIPKRDIEDVDVLFFGIQNDRRMSVLRELGDRGLKVVALNNVWGAERDTWIARSKVVLNIHRTESGQFEIVRVLFLLANGKAVVSESSADGSVDEGLQGRYVAVPYDGLVDACIRLIESQEAREALQARATAVKEEDRLQALPYVEHGVKSLFVENGNTEERSWNPTGVTGMPGPMQSFEVGPPDGLAHGSITDESGQPMNAPLGIPRVLNIGSGYRFFGDCVNADIDPKWNPDWLVDIGLPLNLPMLAETRRFGSIQIAEGMFEKIIAYHVLEHVPNLVLTMTNLLSLLHIGGELHVEVPYDLSYGAWQDPTHLRAFNERSWWYFTDMCWYLGWTRTRFFLAKQEFVLSPLGQSYKEKEIPTDEILLRPRAVDAMRVVLTKGLIQQA